MIIHAETLKKLRKARGLSQEMLADVSGVSKKTIARIETGKGGETRGGTAKELAKALGVKIEGLAKEFEDEDNDNEQDVSRRMRGWTFYHPRIPLSGKTLLDYGLVREHYRVDALSLIRAAPLLFTLLAEMSLADRRRRADEVEAALKEKPEHLGFAAEADLDSEFTSISLRDIFAGRVRDDDAARNEEYFDEEERNPFSDFLGRLAKELGPQNDAIAPENIHFDADRGGFHHRFSLFKKFREKLTGGSSRASCALDSGYARIRDIPRELMPGWTADEKKDKDEAAAAARVKWLEERIPDEDWEEWEEEESKLAIAIREFEIEEEKDTTNDSPNEGGSENA